MYAYRDILKLADLTTRLYVLLSSLPNLPPLHMSLPADSDSPQIALGNVDTSIPTFGTHNAPLVKTLNLTLSTGEHLMITGSNGVGKIAVARALSMQVPGINRAEEKCLSRLSTSKHRLQRLKVCKKQKQKNNRISMAKREDKG
jgi:ABC-type protease/lipase transport system fused ATPase/permease subunit